MAVRFDQMAWCLELGQAVRDQREQGVFMTQQDVAVRSAVDQGQISRFERGKESLGIDKARAVLNAVGLDLAIVTLDSPSA